MSLAEYAESQARFGVKIVAKNGCYWRRVRPFFYRPLLPVKEIPGSAEELSPVSWPGGFQCAVPPGSPANSTMNFLMLDDLSGYHLDQLGPKRRSLVTRAAREFEVRPIGSAQELKNHGHPVYLSFFNRTGYSYRSERRQKPEFDQWVDHLYMNPKVVLIGGYGPAGLAAFSLWYWVERTLVYATLVSETEAMRKSLGELMFHEARLLAAQQSGLDEIFVRNYQGGNSIDQYHLLRGCKLVRKPAVLKIPFPLQTLLRRFAPEKHAALVGHE